MQKVQNVEAKSGYSTWRTRPQ